MMKTHILFNLSELNYAWQFQLGHSSESSVKVVLASAIFLVKQEQAALYLVPHCILWNWAAIFKEFLSLKFSI